MLAKGVPTIFSPECILRLNLIGLFYFMTGYPVLTCDLAPGRDFVFADFSSDRAARVEAAAGGRFERAGNLAFEYGAFAGAVFFRVGNRHGGEQSLRIGVKRILI